ncbi:hypothetical protein K7X08_007254 [Anisodus acutangulus]|uniref:Copper transporter n=1 Tax=Anisodus acutangulus TaxID=402998 RepID=A0A9Q1R045_9SOLA|nr:hypothetical protein K7X08_007254 [Anisodus acutangulus]
MWSTNNSVYPKSLSYFITNANTSILQSSVSSSYWISYTKKQFQGWPDCEITKGGCLFPVYLIFLLALISEFCSLYPFSTKKEEKGLKVLVQESAFHGLRMFMTYLVVIFIITTDFRFFLVAVTGHAAGRFVCKVYQYHNDQEMSTESPSQLVTKV